MARTQLDSSQFKDGGAVGRDDLIINVVGKSVIARLIEQADTGVKLNASTGSDTGTGDVSLKLDLTYLDTKYPSITASRSAANVLIAPTASAGTPTWRALVAADTPAVLPLAGGVMTGNITFNNYQVTNPATYPSPSYGFVWNISSDGAGMKVFERGADQLDYMFFMRDNVASNDRFVWQMTDWKGVHGTVDAMVLVPGGSLSIRNSTQIYGQLTLESPTLMSILKPNRVDNTQAYSAVTITRGNSIYHNPDIGASTIDINTDVTAYSGTAARAYVIKIKTGGTGVTNTFCWGAGPSVGQSTAAATGWSGYDIAVSTDWITLEFGIKIKFTALTGGVNDETFGFTVLPGSALIVNSTAASSFAGALTITGTTTFIGTTYLGTAASAVGLISSTSHGTKGKVQIGNSAFDEVNNRLGVNTVSPGYTLDVNGTSNFTNTMSLDVPLASGSAAIYFKSAGVWKTALYRPTNTDDLRIDSSTVANIFNVKVNGNIQIGNATDAGYKFDVNGTGRFVNSLSILSGNGYGQLKNNKSKYRWRSVYKLSFYEYNRE